MKFAALIACLFLSTPVLADTQYIPITPQNALGIQAIEISSPIIMPAVQHAIYNTDELEIMTQSPLPGKTPTVTDLQLKILENEIDAYAAIGRLDKRIQELEKKEKQHSCCTCGEPHPMSFPGIHGLKETETGVK